MKRRSVLLIAMLAVMMVPMLSYASTPGGMVSLGNQDLLVKKDTFGNIILQPAGPYVLEAGQTMKITNVTGDSKVIQAVYRNDSGGTVASAVIAQGASDTQTQGTGATRIAKVTVTDETNVPHNFWISEAYAPFPGIGTPGLVGLSILLIGAAAWALGRRRGQLA